MKSVFQLVGQQSSSQNMVRRPGTPTVSVKKVQKQLGQIDQVFTISSFHFWCINNIEYTYYDQDIFTGEGVGRRRWLDRRIEDPEERSQVFPSLEERTKATPGERILFIKL